MRTLFALSLLLLVTSEAVSPEDLFQGLRWGMDAREIRKVYARGNKLIEPSPGVWQDLDVKVHDWTAFVAFWIGPRGLHFASVSFFFESGGRRLTKENVLSKSKRTVEQLNNIYGKPALENPWNGSFFNYVWLTQNTLIQFAWNGADNWAIHYRSRRLDPIAQEVLRQLQ